MPDNSAHIHQDEAGYTQMAEEIQRQHLNVFDDWEEDIVAYTQFHGWILFCEGCGGEVRGKTKKEALAGMQKHYDTVTHGKAGRLK